ncbi:MAG: prepilin-type N-terminal cleavage/methylation domain-containing protein [Armatimonadetes bacterium]|nr:MAG: prepilin-type N-terminal cleavage/methylation domain-containing protein [Armatimonadota bacterium]KXK19545.1 MAG: hypothetical protein UZ18_ATM001000607 [Armatimonadetes bacterium OLB18]MBV6491113.1 hypothetical protein [Fimbriimonadaceae bacterium]QOJ10921.1 MAG: prepilin-type N-terminal cleavage/methylation domain-containing protein [Chthonomonadaceae bacterium]MBL1152385.1 prepilin-type N-terminal cleavage/methylation domain-containing protein [Armatimonadota bacterium]
MHRKAFTLIELLVVIAIIAILAAILFPVFAQAKVAAKKAAAISNQKQIGLAVLMYMADADDTYPRNDDCYLNSSLNTALNNQTGDPSPWCNGTNGYPFRMNHYSWQKWVVPYVKNIQLFEHPARTTINANTFSCPQGQWTQCGQIMGSFAINLALTGALNTWNRSATAAGRLRNSWLGGRQSGLPDVSKAMLLFEMGNPEISFAPVTVTTDQNPLSTQTVYPMAVREFWRANFMKASGAGCVFGNEPDPRATVGGNVVVGFADGSAKAVPAGQFLAWTPTAAEFNVTLDANTLCGISSGTFRPSVTSSALNLNINYPFWGLTN